MPYMPDDRLGQPPLQPQKPAFNLARADYPRIPGRPAQINRIFLELA